MFDTASKKSTELAAATDIEFHSVIDGWLYFELKEAKNYKLYRLKTNSKTTQIQPFGQ